MSKKNTNYQKQLNLLPIEYKPTVNSINTHDEHQKIAHLVLLDMLQVLKM